MRTVYLYGAGGHAKVIIDILKSNRITVSEIFDDNPAIHTFMGIPVSHTNIRSPLIISIGNNAIRKKIVEKFNNVIYYPALLANSVSISDLASIKEGTVVMQGAIIQSSAQIGKHVIINTRASIDHDCLIEDYVHIAPGAILCGNVEVGEGSFIGAGTTIMQGIKIGKWSIIGAGSVVVRDIPDNVTAFGNPCRIIN
ncbi:MAG: acetyltransferase [Dysgonamonadaceae bacterium]|jgi:sugar O-acyltransferase (sialic acid O-acetyltransferase NeuD family)|nr:acetyltransferase [Dysgonamonadaceae bacterium]